MEEQNNYTINLVRIKSIPSIFFDQCDYSARKSKNNNGALRSIKSHKNEIKPFSNLKWSIPVSK